MVSFSQVSGRFYVPEAFAGNVARARIAFVVHQGQPTPAQIDPAGNIGRGTICLFPTLTAVVAANLPNSAPAALDSNGGATIRLALFAANGALRSGTELVLGGADGVITQDAQVLVGVKVPGAEPTGNGRWGSIFEAGGKMVGAGDRIGFEFPAAATSLGLLLGPLSSLVPLPQNHRRYELILSGVERGLFRFPAEVDARSADGLGLGMRFFLPGTTAGAETSLLSHPYPIYELSAKQRFGLVVDFAAPYEHETVDGRDRPRTMFYPPSGGLRSNLHAVHGQIVTMAPSAVEPDIGFRLTRSPSVVNSGGSLVQVNHYLTPHGRFRLAREDGADQPLRLALGLSNLESLQIDPGAGDHLSFDHGHALLGGDSGAAFADSQFDLDVLDKHCRTAWTSFVRGDSAADDTRPLAIDPEGMPGYVSGPNPDMPFRPSRFPRPEGAFPMVPLLGLARATGNPAQRRERLDLERSVISRVRRSRLTTVASLQADLASASLTEEQARTPHGYLAERAAGSSTWAKITLGRTAQSPKTEQVSDFGLLARTDAAKLELAKVVAGNRLFLVTRASTLRSLGFEERGFQQVFMAGWEAALLRASGGMTGSDPIVILKHDDRPVSELYKDPSNWTARDVFLRDADDLAKVQQQIERSLDASKDPSGLYAQLRRRLNDPNWNGALVLEATLYSSGLPDQLKALAASLPDLKIHHVGVDLSAIASSADDGKAWPTAVFGVVDYDGSNADWERDPGLSMRVTRLILRIENDSVDRFECTVELKLHSLFDVPAKDAEKVFKLEGRYESRVDKNGNKEESYRFVAERADGGSIFQHEFEAPSLIKRVRLDRLQLLTIQDDGVFKGRYLLDGDIEFGEIGELDILGMDALDFTGFGLDFDLKPFKVTFKYPSMRLDFGGFNRGAIKRRAGSFLSKFPLKLRGFRIGEFKLPELGYFNFGDIDLPGGFEASSNFKFGFEFDLDLGSLGALAKKLDRFKMKLIVGWKPVLAGAKLDKNLFALGFRLDLGEGAGGIDVGLQGILRLKAERFNLKKVKHPVAEKGDVIVLSAYNAVLEILGQRLPTKEDQRFSIFLFGDIGNGLFERPGWYASFKDASPSKPIALDRLTMGQRVNVRFDDLTSTMAAITWLDGQETFGKGDEKKFVDFAGQPGSVVKYDPDREWFFAAKGEFFSVARVALLLRDPDLYGAYLGILGSADAPIFSFDLLYEKLGDGVGRYSVEVLLPEAFRSIEVGVFSITIGVIRAELYTNGGFLIDLGMPKHVDYSRSFVVQGGPFIGKGGIYVGRVPREAAPIFDGLNIGDVFRAGMALRVGLGREFEKGPLRLGVSVSVFGRVEGAFARLKDGSSYAVALQGEVGIIAELEGSVDLKLVRARVLIRIWVAAGVALVTGKNVLLHCEAGVDVSVVVVIGRIRVFGRSIEIKIRLSYHTQVRFEWELPARMPAVGLLEAALVDPTPWVFPDIAKLGVSPAPIRLRLAFDAARVMTAAGPRGRAIPSVIWLADDGPNAGRAPFAEIGRALVAWAVLQLEPTAAGADQVSLAKSAAVVGAVPVKAVRDQLATFDEIDPTLLQKLFNTLFDGSSLSVVPDETEGTAYAFPTPPGLMLQIGDDVVDFGNLGVVTDAEADGMMAHLDDQFAEISQRRTAAVGGAPRPLVERIFQEWCQLLALTTLDALDHAFDTGGRADETVALGKLWPSVDWAQVAGRAGRLFHSGVRIQRPDGVVEPLLAPAGLMLEVDAAAKPEVKIAGVGMSVWLIPTAASTELDGAAIARLGAGSPAITATLAEAPAVRLAARGFALPNFARVQNPQGQVKALLGEFSADLRRQLPEGAAFPEALAFAARKPRTEGQGPIDEIVLAHATKRVLVFDMALEQVPVKPGLGGKPEHLKDAFQIAGASEAERLGLDAVLRGSDAEVAARLAGSRLSLAWKILDEAGHARLTRPEAAPEDVLLARATVSIERRPMDAGLDELVEPEDIYRATLASGERFAALSLLQRAAVVNSGGTYLVVTSALGDALTDAFAEQTRIQLSFVLEYADAAPIESAAVNAVLITHSDDIALVDPPGGVARILTAKLGADVKLEDFTATAPGLVEAVSLRAPGTELLRVWRKAPAPAASGASMNAQVAAHLANQFDMLEFQVEDEAGAVLLAFDGALPLASEVAVPDQGPSQIKAWLDEERRAAGYQADDYRYDLILPLARLAARQGHGAGPYAGVGRTYRVRTGWRDLYGNRLDSAQQQQDIQLLYRDPLIAVDAWPGVNAAFGPGAAASRALELALEVDPSEVAQGPNSLAAQGLARVIDQLAAPGVSLALETPLGAADGAFAVAELVAWLRTVAVYIAGGGAAPAPFRRTLTLTAVTNAPFVPLELHLVISRAEELVAKDAVAGVNRINSPISATIGADAAESGAARRFAAAFQDAFSTAAKPAAYWVARGQTNAGDSAWWAVDARVVPIKDQHAPVGYAPPPLALAELSAVVPDVPVIPPAGPNGTYANNTFAATEERKGDVRAHDRDSDELMREFLVKVDAFLSPLNAPVTARAPAAGATATPFERIARVRAALLGRDDGAASPLLAFVQGVRKSDVGDGASRTEALRSLREACAAELERYSGVGGVLVQPLASRIPAGWFPIEGRPKIYGRLRFDTPDEKALGFRALARGIELRDGRMELGIVVLPETQEGSVNLSARAAVAYECSHVERIVDRPGGAGRLAPSRWLTFVPVERAGQRPVLPTVTLAASGEDLVAPTPFRRVPLAPEVSNPVLSPYDGDPTTTYDQSVAAARRWTFGFDIGAEFAGTDQFCGRLVYNGGLGSSQIQTATPAEPLFPNLFNALVAFEAKAAAYWPVIVQEAARRVAGGGTADGTRFENACSRFAEAVEEVLAGLAHEAALDEPADLLEDRFIVTDEDGGGRRRTKIAFVDHLAENDPPRPPEAGEGAPWLKISQISGTEAHPPINPQAQWPGGVFEFDKPEKGLRRRRLEIGRLDAVRLQSVWAAGSVRRNARIGGQPAQRRFVYRTPELYLQQVSVPHLVRRRSIAMEDLRAESLAARLQRALAPVFARQMKPIPVQIRFDFESGRIIDLLSNLAGGGDPHFVPDPDAKVQFAGKTIGIGGDWTVAELAQHAAEALEEAFAVEPPSARGAIVIGVGLRTADSGPGQPLLQLTRLVVPISGLTPALPE